MNELLNRIVGDVLTEVSLVKYPYIGIQRVVLVLAVGQNIELLTEEFKIGRDEAYQLIARECPDQLAGIERLKAGWRIGRYEILRRQEWVEVGKIISGLIGENPRLHSWGPIGSAPPNALHATIVTFAAAFFSDDLGHAFMAHVSDYPGLLKVSTDAAEIREFCRTYGKNEY